MFQSGREQVRPGDHGNNARFGRGGRAIDPEDPRVCVRRAHEDEVKQALRPEIAGVSPGAGGKTTLHFGAGRSPYLLLPIIPEKSGT